MTTTELNTLLDLIDDLERTTDTDIEYLNDDGTPRELNDHIFLTYNL
jgi:hypothetical protein